MWTSQHACITQDPAFHLIQRATCYTQRHLKQGMVAARVKIWTVQPLGWECNVFTTWPHPLLYHQILDFCCSFFFLLLYFFVCMPQPNPPRFRQRRVMQHKQPVFHTRTQECTACPVYKSSITHHSAATFQSSAMEYNYMSSHED